MADDVVVLVNELQRELYRSYDWLRSEELSFGVAPPTVEEIHHASAICYELIVVLENMPFGEISLKKINVDRIQETILQLRKWGDLSEEGHESEEVFIHNFTTLVEDLRKSSIAFLEGGAEVWP